MSQGVLAMVRNPVLGWMIFFASLPVARAADAMKDALAAVPEDAVGFICVANVKGLDAKVKGTLTKLGLAEAVPPPMSSLAGLMRTYLGMSAGLEENGPVILVQMGAESSDALANRQVFVVPASDPKALLESMSAQPGEQGLWTLNVMGRPAHAATAEKRVILAQTPEMATAVAGSKGSIVTKFKAKDLAALEGLDVCLWADGDRLIKLFKQQIDMFTGMFMMSAGGDPMATKQMESAKKNIDMMLEGTRAGLLGISLGEAGLGLRFGLATKPGSEFARRMNIKSTSGPLLQGLAGGDYMAAAGQIIDPSRTKESLSDLDVYFSMAEGEESIDKEQLAAVRSTLEEWLLLLTSFRTSVRALPAGPAGMIGAEVVFGTSDAKKWLELFGKLMTDGKKISSNAEFKEVMEALVYQADAEEVAGAKVHHLKVDLSKVEEMEEEDIEEIDKVVGKDGLLLRLAAADDHNVVICFGGGANRAGELIQQAKKGDAPLEDHLGIKNVSAKLPKERSGAAYVALDQILRFANDVAKQMEEEPLPFPVPELNAPIGFNSSSSEDWLQGDMFLPMELIVAGKNVVMTMMQGPGGAAGEPGEAPEKPATTQPE